MIQVNDKWFRLLAVGLPFLTTIYFRVFFQGKLQWSTIGAILLTLVAAILIVEGNRRLIYRSRDYFVRIRKRWLRLLVVIPAGMLFTSFVFATIKILSNYIRLGNWTLESHMGSTIHFNDIQLTVNVFSAAATYSVFIFLILLGVFETLYHFARLRHVERERDSLERKKLKAELQQLKGIINPHFLFNNLNSLSSLISEDPVQAERFLNELTKVFRYLLRTNETELITLASELELLQSYFHLLETRFGKGVQLKTAICGACYNQLLPPLTLQLLVENAVKHNHFNKENPLMIEIVADTTDRLLVRNTLRKKEGFVESTGIGMSSINGRYMMLNHPAPTVEMNTATYTVTLFLIAGEDASSSPTFAATRTLSVHQAPA